MRVWPRPPESPHPACARARRPLARNSTPPRKSLPTQGSSFTSVSYRYDPKAVGGVTGYALTFQVSEQPALAPVELDIPGQDAEHLWQQLKTADGFMDRQMPNNDRASAYYKRAIEAVLRKSNHPEEIVMKNEADLQTHKMAIVCRPANLPKIAAIRFEGNAAIAEGGLQTAMAKVAMGQDYSERDFRRMLEFNVRPLYEELGRLTVAFPRMNMARADDAAVTVTAGIDEGPVWRLGKVVLTGDALPLAHMHEAARFAYGDPANWKQFMTTRWNRCCGGMAISRRPRSRCARFTIPRRSWM